MPFFEASAPGRLDVMGGIADYSGSLVLQMPIRQKTTVKVYPRTDFVCNLESITETGERLSATINYLDFLTNDYVDYRHAEAAFKKLESTHWTAYIVGCALVLQKEKQLSFRGADFFISSNVPLGKGVSSSASLEVATMKALAKAFDLSFQGTELARLAQRVENLIVGAPCGLMDQLSSYFGEPNKLLPIVCQPDIIGLPITIPNDIHFIGIDSGVRHSVGGASYSDVRCATFMGFSIIAQAMGASRNDINDAIKKNNYSQLPLKGYLSNLSVSDFETEYQKVLPDRISGREYLNDYGPSIDSATIIDPSKYYSIGICTSHPIYENFRVHRFRELIESLQQTENPSPTILKQMGDLMFQSHDSYSRCGLGSSRTDEVVESAKKWDSVYGAKITGGGSGGTVCLLAKGQQGKESIYQLHRRLCSRFNAALNLFE